MRRLLIVCLLLAGCAKQPDALVHGKIQKVGAVVGSECVVVLKVANGLFDEAMSVPERDCALMKEGEEISLWVTLDSYLVNDGKYNRKSVKAAK